MDENTLPTGVTEQTPENIMLGAGTIHNGLAYVNGAWNFDETLVGATLGGNKLSIKPEVKQIEVDGAYVAVKGLDVKLGETAQMEINFVELTPEIMKSALIAEATTSPVAGYTQLESKPQITEGDYWLNVAFVGQRLDGKAVIAVLPNAICTSGLDLEGKKKDPSVQKVTFEARQQLTGDLRKLPYQIYYPEEEN